MSERKAPRDVTDSSVTPGGRATRRRRNLSCEWCGGAMTEYDLPNQGWTIEYHQRLAVWHEAFGAAKRKPRFGKRFCSGSCRQRSYEARKWCTWTVDGETLTGQQLVDRGWVLSSEPSSTGKPNARRKIVARPPR